VTYSVSATTRAKRSGEEEGRHYHYLDREEFQRRVAAGEFVEWAEYGGNLYGTLSAEVERGLAAGQHIVLDIDVEGARQVRQRFPNAVLVFVLPPSATVLVQRLRGRNTEEGHVVERRMGIAAAELLAAKEYDYVVVNDDFVEAVSHVAAILDVEARRVGRFTNFDTVIAHLRRDLAGLQQQIKE
jgi:guanylate kinase